MTLIQEKELLIAYQHLQEVIVSYQSRLKGLDALLLEELQVEICRQVNRILDPSCFQQASTTIYGDKIRLPRDVIVCKNLHDNYFQYEFSHAILGKIGSIWIEKGGGSTLECDIQVKASTTPSPIPAQLLGHIEDTLRTNSPYFG